MSSENLQHKDLLALAEILHIRNRIGFVSLNIIKDWQI